ncbi:MAG: hypothetical protein ACRELB_03130 [Polyangiaceae bacterium]
MNTQSMKVRVGSLVVAVAAVAVVAACSGAGAGSGGGSGGGSSSSGGSNIISSSSSGGGSSSGGAASSSGGGTSSSGGGATCPVSFSDSACDSCFQNSCAGACDACAGDQACNTALLCVLNCSTTTCEDGCLATLSGASAELFDGMFADPAGCFYSSCRSDCTTPSKNGDPCISAADCESEYCESDGTHEGWCGLASCSSNQQCGIDTAGELVWCVSTSGGGYGCFPGCTTNADCAGYTCSSTNASPTCNPGTSVNGSTANVCGC